jgi:hypothetical protein
LSDDGGFAEVATGDEAGEPRGPVIASAGGVDGWSASEFADAENDGGLEEISLVEVADERAEGGIEDLALGCLALVIGDVRIEAGECDFDDADTGFDESSGNEAAASEFGVAVGLFEVCGFVVEQKGFELCGRHHAESFLGEVIVKSLPGGGGVSVGEVLAEELEVFEPAVLAFWGNRCIEVGDGFAWLVESEGVPGISEVSAFRDSESGCDGDVGRDFEIWSGEFADDDSSESWIFQGGFWSVAAAYEGCTAFMITFFGGD